MDPYEWKVQYYETDQMGIVHHSNYLRWMESARMDYMAQAGISYKEMEQRGILSPVLTASCKYRKMTRFGDTVLIIPQLKAYNSIRLVFTYQVIDKRTGALNATGETSHCYLNREGKPVALKKAAPEIDAVFRRFYEGQKKA